jgi:hypothetical protein
LLAGFLIEDKDLLISVALHQRDNSSATDRKSGHANSTGGSPNDWRAILGPILEQTLLGRKAVSIGSQELGPFVFMVGRLFDGRRARLSSRLVCENARKC